MAFVLRLSLLAAVLTAVAGCASVPLHRTHPELPQRKGDIITVGFLPPVITVFEEQAQFGLNKLVLHPEWSPSAEEAVSRALAEEMTVDQIPLVPISADDHEVKDLVDLYAAVEFSIQRHAWEKESGRFPPREPFPEKVRSFDYSLGPAREVMERYQVDAVWVVRGFNLLPTTGARIKDGIEIALAILSGVGGARTYKKIELRVALVDRIGSVLYYGTTNDWVGRPEEQTYLGVDLRDPRVARHYINAALKEYRMEASP
jgi:hypothetical protein